MPLANLTAYNIKCPPTVIAPDRWNRITLLGEAAGDQEVNWFACPQCNYGTRGAGFCFKCKVPRVYKPQGFVGGSGQLLRKTCAAAGIEFERCNRTNVVKYQPPGNDFSKFYKDPKRRTQPTDELKWWRELLIAELVHTKPNVIVALGNEALKAITEFDGITKYAGSILVHPTFGWKIIPDMHPAYTMRDNWEQYYLSVRFFRKVLAEAQFKERVLKEEPDEFVIKPQLDQVLQFLHEIQYSNQPWYLDVETRGDTLSCFGLSSDRRPSFAICVPIQLTTGPAWSVEHEAIIFSNLSRCMEGNPHFRNQNCVYDIDYMLDYRCEPSGIDFDPMVGMNVAYPEFAKGLDATTPMYTQYEYYKDEGKTWKKSVPDERVFTYNCKDMVVTPKVSNGVRADLAEMGLLDTYRKRSNRFLPIAIEMQRNKLMLDQDWHRCLATYLAEEQQKVHAQLVERIGHEINVKSNPDCCRLLYEELRLPTKYNRKTKMPTADENAIKELRAERGNHPTLDDIITERHLRTKQSNYINVEFDKGNFNELYLGYQANIGGAKTGRWSFSTSPKWRGGSPQVIPKVMRLMYVPPSGSCFWQRDLSQAEARIVAWLSHCRFLLDVFASPIKIHKLIAGRIFGKPPEAIIQDTPEYDIAKRIVHGYNYMMQFKKIAITAHVSYEFAKNAYAVYGKEVHEISSWHQAIKAQVIKSGRLVTPMGRIRQCYKACSALTHTGTFPEEILRDLVSYIPQSTVPDVLNEGMGEVWESLPWIRWHQQGHDSYLCSGEPNRTEEVFEVSERAAKKVTLRINGEDCYIPGDFTWGYNWGAMVGYRPGEATTIEAWKERVEAEGLMSEAKIKEKLYSLI